MPNDYNHLSREELLVLLEKSETENRRLKSSQGFLSQGFDHAPLPTIRITPEGIVEEVNPYTCDFFGMPRETLIGINVLNNGPEEQIQSARENIARLTPRDNTFYQYVCHLTPTQQVVYYLWCNVGIFDPEGKLQYIISYCMPKNLQENFAKELREQALVNLKIEQENQNIITDVLHILAQQDTFSCENILQLVNSHYHTEFSAVFRYEEEDLSYHMKDYAIQEASALNKFLPQMKTYGFFSRSETLEHFRQGHMKVVYSDENAAHSVFMDFFRAQQVHFESALAIPLFVNNHFHGFLAAIRENYDLRWTENEISLYQLFAKVVALNIERIIIQKKLDRENRAHYARAGTQRSLLVGIRHRTRFLLQQRGSAQTLRLSDRTATAVRRTDVYRPRPFRRPGGHTQGLRKNQQRSGRRRAGPVSGYGAPTAPSVTNGSNTVS